MSRINTVQDFRRPRSVAGRDRASLYSPRLDPKSTQTEDKSIKESHERQMTEPHDHPGVVLKSAHPEDEINVLRSKNVGDCRTSLTSKKVVHLARQK